MGWLSQRDGQSTQHFEISVHGLVEAPLTLARAWNGVTYETTIGSSLCRNCAFRDLAFRHRHIINPMFDQEHPMELIGTVKELRYMGPHTFIILDVKDGNGGTQLWNLEGGLQAVCPVAAG
jgi:hypothetical protein